MMILTGGLMESTCSPPLFQDPCENHAVVMGKFAKYCLEEFQKIVLKLDEELGPGTADLGLRTGLHSGPVTAGVIRGERVSFFQQSTATSCSILIKVSHSMFFLLVRSVGKVPVVR